MDVTYGCFGGKGHLITNLEAICWFKWFRH